MSELLLSLAQNTSINTKFDLVIKLVEMTRIYKSRCLELYGLSAPYGDGEKESFDVHLIIDRMKGGFHFIAGYTNDNGEFKDAEILSDMSESPMDWMKGIYDQAVSENSYRSALADISTNIDNCSGGVNRQLLYLEIEDFQDAFLTLIDRVKRLQQYLSMRYSDLENLLDQRQSQRSDKHQ